MHRGESTSSPVVINKHKHNADLRNHFWALEFARPTGLPTDKYINRKGSYLLKILRVWLLKQFANPFMVSQKPVFLKLIFWFNGYYGGLAIQFFVITLWFVSFTWRNCMNGAGGLAGLKPEHVWFTRTMKSNGVQCIYTRNVLNWQIIQQRYLVCFSIQGKYTFQWIKNLRSKIREWL